MMEQRQGHGLGKSTCQSFERLSFKTDDIATMISELWSGNLKYLQRLYHLLRRAALPVIYADVETKALPTKNAKIEV